MSSLIIVGCMTIMDGPAQKSKSPGTTPTGGENTITIDKIPWENNVDDDDVCQPVKEQKIGEVLIKCKGECTQTRPDCILQKRLAGSENKWADVPTSMEEGDSNYEYRCICR